MSCKIYFLKTSICKHFFFGGCLGFRIKLNVDLTHLCYEQMKVSNQMLFTFGSQNSVWNETLSE